MKCLTLFLLTLLLSTAALARAEGRKLVIGTVYRVVRNLIEVKEEGHDITIVRVDASTTYVNSSTETPAKLKDLQVGDQIVIKVISKDGVDTAEQVKFVPATGSRKQASNLR
jgi:hypothetical protein